MIKHTKVFALIIILIIVLSLCSCKKADILEQYQKEDAASTGYGTTIKSALYIEDFYFLTVGTEKSKVDTLIGSAHYHNENNELLPVYTLNNGDTLAIEYDGDKKTIVAANYTYQEDLEKESFFDILVELEILASPSQETTGEDNTNIQSGQIDQPGTSISPITPDNSQQPEIQLQQVAQGEVFASGLYNFNLIEPLLKLNMSRDEIIRVVGKPNYFFSHNFKSDTYIIDCYNLSDGTKLYLDYGFERNMLRCAAIYKNGTISSLLGTPWSEQSKPNGFTRLASDFQRVNRLSKNMTPAKVYAYIGEPAWYEGTRGSYTDVFLLSDGSFAYLNFGSAHNKLTSVSIKGTDGSITVVKLN